MGFRSVIILLAVLLSLPLGARAVSLDGVLIYATDDFGNPIGFDWETETMGQGLWRWETLVARTQWHGLGILNDLPPDSLRGVPMNDADFTVSIPLADGVNDFTLVGATGGGNDDYQRLAVNLFFDAILDHPSISVLVPGDSPLSGGPPAPNRSDRIMTLSLDEPLRMTPQATYSDGTVSVSVIAASFRRYPDLDVAIVAPQSLVSDGTRNWVGVLRLAVEAADTQAMPVLRGPVRPAAPVNAGGEVRIGPDTMAGPQYAGGHGANALPGTDVLREAESGVPALADTSAAGDALQTASPSAVPTAASTTPAAAVSTPSPAASIAQTSGRQGTPATPGTPVPSTRIAPASPSVARTVTAAYAAVTPSPAAQPSK